MSSDKGGQTIMVTSEGAAAVTDLAAVKREFKCPLTDPHIHRDDLRKVWRECQEHSFWYRALPLSVGSMGVTGALIYKGIWQSSKRFGPFPKLAVAGILGYAVGKASYVGICRSKFQELGLDVGPPFRGPFNRSGPGHRRFQHVCEDSQKEAKATTVEQGSS